jgi:hypothetical protein
MADVVAMFYALSGRERIKLIKFIKSIVVVEDPDMAVMVPVDKFIHFKRNQMSSRLRNVLIRNKKSLPLYIDMVTRERFMLMSGGGKAMWEEFCSLRRGIQKEIINENNQLENEEGDDVRED